MTEKITPRLKTRYVEEVRPALRHISQQSQHNSLLKRKTSV